MSTRHSFLILAVLVGMASPKFAGADEISIKVNGMVCSLCARGIEKQLRRDKEVGVEKVHVDLDSKVVQITLPDAAKLSDEKIRDAIRDAGYEVVEVERKVEKKSHEPTTSPAGEEEKS